MVVVNPIAGSQPDPHRWDPPVVRLAHRFNDLDVDLHNQRTHLVHARESAEPGRDTVVAPETLQARRDWVPVVEQRITDLERRRREALQELRDLADHLLSDARTTS